MFVANIAVMLVVIIIMGLLYIKISHPFWAIQPVFHVYDVHYWFRNAGVLLVDMPKINRFVNPKSITTVEFADASSIVKSNMCNLIRQHYFRNLNTGNTYCPTDNHIIPYLQAHNAPVFISYYTKQQTVIDKGEIMNIPVMAGVITSRPLHVLIHNQSMDVYYVDFLCVHSQWRKQQIAPQLIQTHEYQQSRRNRSICVSLFKREDELTLIVPTIAYSAMCFEINKPLMNESGTLPSGYNIIPLSSQTLHDLHNFLETEKTKWDLWICPSVAHLLVLTNSKNLFIYMCVVHNQVQGVYVFRNTATRLSHGKPIVTCVAVIHSDKLNIRMAAMMECVRHIKKHESYKNIQLCIEPLGHLHDMIPFFKNSSNPTAVTKMAYYWYNFAHQPFTSSKCVIIT